LVNGDAVVLIGQKQDRLVLILANGNAVEVETDGWTLESVEAILGEVIDMTQKPSPLFTPAEFMTPFTGLPDLSSLFGEGGEEGISEETTQ